MEKRFQKAREYAFNAVEILYPYEYSKRDLKNWLEESNAEMILINTFPGDVKNGEKGFAACPGREKDFQDSFKLAVDYCLALKCERLHVMAGNTDGADLKECERSYRKNLLWAIREVGKHGVTLLIEPLTPQYSPGYFLNSMQQAVDIISELRTSSGTNNPALQLDVYHLGMMEQNIFSSLPLLLPWTSHVQISDIPGRCEPGKGALDFPAFFDALEKFGYAGWVACEYQPSETTEKSLEWFASRKR